MNKEARDLLLLHQFVAKLPKPIMKQLWASWVVKSFETVVMHLRLLKGGSSGSADRASVQSQLTLKGELGGEAVDITVGV